jgi:hypothetical protein
MTIIENQPAPLAIESILAKVILSPADKKAINAAQSRIAEIMALIASTEPDRHGRTSELHREADAIEQVFAEEPTRENAEALHDALVRVRDAEVSFARIDAVCNATMNAASRSLAAVAMSALDAALKNFDASAAQTRRSMIETASVFGEDGEMKTFDSRLAITRANLEAERTDARSNPLHWLSFRGLA